MMIDTGITIAGAFIATGGETIKFGSIALIPMSGGTATPAAAAGVAIAIPVEAVGAGVSATGTLLLASDIQGYNSASKAMRDAKMFESSSQYSGKLIKVDKEDAAADALAERIGGESRVKFENDPNGREFDVVSDKYIAQAKPPLKGYGQSWRNQTKATFEAAKQTGREAYFYFDGSPSSKVLSKIEEYSLRYGVNYIIDTTPLVY